MRRRRISVALLGLTRSVTRMRRQKMLHGPRRQDATCTRLLGVCASEFRT